MEMINWLRVWLETGDNYLWYLLGLILIANIIDFGLGWVIATFSKEKEFSTNKAIYGIVRKLSIFIVLVYFIPVALLAPNNIGISAIWILYIGYLASEIRSILCHIGIMEDDKTTDLFKNFIDNIFNRSDK